MTGSPATGEDATDYFFRTPGELRKSRLFDEKAPCGSKLEYLCRLPHAAIGTPFQCVLSSLVTPVAGRHAKTCLDERLVDPRGETSNHDDTVDQLFETLEQWNTELTRLQSLKSPKVGGPKR
jgi:hypothetical protein